MIPRLLAMTAGIWLMFAPEVGDYHGLPADNDRVFGPIAATFAFLAIWEVLRPLRWATVPVGTWLFLAPFILGYAQPPAIVSSLLSGLVIVVTAPLGGKRRRQMGGGWSSLVGEPGDWD